MEIIIPENIFEKIEFSENEKEEFVSIEFADAETINNLPFKRIKVICNSQKQKIFMELTEDVIGNKMELYHSQNEDVGVIGFINSTKDILIITKNEIIDGKIKIEYSELKENYFDILAIKLKTEQKIDKIKNILINANFYAI